MATQFELTTGEHVALFLDKDALAWGDEWRDKLDTALAAVAFFIPVLTPRYFKSAECRRELQYFARRTSAKNVVLPVLYVRVQELLSAEPKDDLCRLVKAFQWVDWQELRFCDVTDSAYRRAVAALAERMAEMGTREDLQEAEPSAGAAIAGLASADTDTVGDADAGILDRIATSEEALPRYSETVEQITHEMHLIGEIASAGGTEMGVAASFAAKRIVAQRTARRLVEPVGRINTLTNYFSSQLHEVDDGLRELIKMGVQALKDEEQENRDRVIQFFGQVRALSTVTTDSLQSVRGFIESIVPVEQMSRDLRPPLRMLRESLTRMLEASEVVQEWIRLIDTAA